MVASSEVGYVTGEICNRNGCKGIIENYGKEGSCSCHVNPPCSYCTASDEFCPVCDWDGNEEQMQKGKSKLEKFYFTFGQNHVDPTTQEKLKDYWVEVSARNSVKASLVVERFHGKEYSMMYVNEPDKTFFPLGLWNRLDEFDFCVPQANFKVRVQGDSFLVNGIEFNKEEFESTVRDMLVKIRKLNINPNIKAMCIDNFNSMMAEIRAEIWKL